MPMMGIFGTFFYFVATYNRIERHSRMAELSVPNEEFLDTFSISGKLKRSKIHLLTILLSKEFPYETDRSLLHIYNLFIRILLLGRLTNPLGWITYLKWNFWIHHSYSANHICPLFHLPWAT